MDEDMPAVVTSPLVASTNKTPWQLRQITISKDEQIENVNKLLADGWRLLSIGYQADSKVVYVVGRAEEKPRHRPGFLGGD